MPSLPLLFDFAPQCLGLPPLRFAIQPLALGCGRGLGGFTLGGRDRDALNQGLETAEGFFSILVLGPVLLGFDHNNPVFGDPVIPEVQQALFVQGREGRSLDIKAQMDGARHFVDVLATGSLGANGGEFDLAEGNGGAGGDSKHGWIQSGASCGSVAFASSPV